MSIRTIIEINHDQLAKLKNDPEWAQKLYDCLATYGWKGERSVFPAPAGARILIDRHHSDDLWIGLNGAAADNYS
jgi:hypothetical protein